jgi:hypothetical protein
MVAIAILMCHRACVVLASAEAGSYTLRIPGVDLSTCLRPSSRVVIYRLTGACLEGWPGQSTGGRSVGLLSVPTLSVSMSG